MAEHRQRLYRALRTLQAELISQVAAAGSAAAPVVLDQAMVGRLSRMDAMQHQEIAKAQQRRAEARLRQVERKIRAYDQGDDNFGLCGDCLEPIPAARLAELPDAELCVSCLQERAAQS